MVSSSMFAKHTRNQPASWQWNEHPGETFSFISLIIIFHSSNSAAKVGSLRRFLKFIHTNSPPLLFRVSIPTWASPLVKVSCLFLSLSELSTVKFSTNSWSDNIAAIRIGWDFLDYLGNADEFWLAEDSGCVDFVAY
nr:1-aminocyclopropane-1-carboxylic acid synthase [Ipomoea trifida]